MRVTRSGWGLARYTALIGALFSGVLLVTLTGPASMADAAQSVNKSTQKQMLRAAAASPGGKGVGLRVGKRGRVTMQPLAWRGPAKIVAVRSSINPSWGLLIALLNGSAEVRHSFMLQKRGGDWRVQWSTNRGFEADEVCKRRSPGTAVVLDLGLSTDNWGQKCRHRRNPAGLVRRMNKAEIGSIRRMVEWKWGANGLKPGPVQPRVREVPASDCNWDGLGNTEAPSGAVARTNPRWGILHLPCGIGSDGFGVLEGSTDLLVRRGGRSGAFAQVLAHVHPGWSARSGFCARDRRWPVPAAARVALGFCTPFPAVIRAALR